MTTFIKFCATYLIGFGMVVSLNACDKEDEEEESFQYALSGNANGANERPNPVTTNGTGSITGTYNKNTNQLQYTITWNNLTVSPIAMHFHGPATTEQVAGPVLTITGFTPAPSGNVNGSAQLTDDQETQLLGGLWYYNIHTEAFPPGEIRGQVTATPQ